DEQSAPHRRPCPRVRHLGRRRAVRDAPQTLRQYDRLGLVSPRRTRGRGRRYSARDISKLREVQRLSQEQGINLAGIKRILELQDEVGALSEQLEQVQDTLDSMTPAQRRVFSAD